MSEPEDKRPSAFIRVRGRIIGAKIKNNIVIGLRDFIQAGSVEQSKIDSNVHVKPNDHHKITKSWHETLAGKITIGVFIGLLVACIVAYFR